MRWGWWLGLAALAAFAGWSRTTNLDADPPPGALGRDRALVADARRVADEARREWVGAEVAGRGTGALVRAGIRACYGWLGLGPVAAAAPAALAGCLAVMLVAALARRLYGDMGGLLAGLALAGCPGFLVWGRSPAPQSLAAPLVLVILAGFLPRGGGVPGCEAVAGPALAPRALAWLLLPAGAWLVDPSLGLLGIPLAWIALRRPAARAIACLGFAGAALLLWGGPPPEGAASSGSRGLSLLEGAGILLAGVGIGRVLRFRMPLPGDAARGRIEGGLEGTVAVGAVGAAASGCFGLLVPFLPAAAVLTGGAIARVARRKTRAAPLVLLGLALAALLRAGPVPLERGRSLACAAAEVPAILPEGASVAGPYAPALAIGSRLDDAPALPAAGGMDALARALRRAGRTHITFEGGPDLDRRIDAFARAGAPLRLVRRWSLCGREVLLYRFVWADPLRSPYERAVDLGRAGDRRGAGEAFLDFARRHPAIAPGWTGLGTQLLWGGEAKAGLRALRQALLWNPHDIDARSAIAAHYLKIGRRGRALGELERLGDDLPFDAGLRRVIREIQRSLRADGPAFRPGVEGTSEPSSREASHERLQGSLRVDPFQCEQPPLQIEPGPEAAQAPVGSDDAVAGDDDGQGVAADRPAHGPRRAGPPDRRRDPAVARQAPEGDAQERPPDPPVEGTPGARIERQGGEGPAAEGVGAQRTDRPR